MKSLAVVHAVHSLHGFLREGRRRPTPRLEVGQDMHVVDVDGCGSGQLPMRLAPRSARLVSSETLARVLVHRIDVGIERQRCRQHGRSVGVVVAQDNGRRVGTARSLQTVLDTGDDGLCHPFDVRLDARHGLTQTNEEAHPRVFLHEGGNRLARVVADERRNRTVAVLRLQSVVVGKGLREDDVVEHLDDADAAPVGLIHQKSEHLLILLHRSIVNFGCERIVLQLHQRGKRMAVPQVDGVHIVLGQQVKIAYPEVAVVEPREVLRRVRVLIDAVAWQVDRLLQPHTSAAKLHLWQR